MLLLLWLTLVVDLRKCFSDDAFFGQTRLVATRAIDIDLCFELGVRGTLDRCDTSSILVFALDGAPNDLFRCNVAHDLHTRKGQTRRR